MLDKLKFYGLLAGGFIASILVAYSKGKGDQKRENQADANEKLLQKIEKNNELKRAVNRMSIDDIRNKLRQKWVRD